MHLMQGKGQIPAHDDEVTLCQILNIHHTPYKGQTVGAERKHRTNEYAVQNDLHIDDGRPHKQQL